jgi:MSHA biogenesis protein MshO
MRRFFCRVGSALLSTRQTHQGHAKATLRVGQGGFTLVELVLVIALAGVVAVMISAVLSRPLQGFVDQSRRAELTDQVATALNRMARDIRMAVPNSVRESANGLDFLPMHEAGRYQGGLDVHGALQDPPICVTNPCQISMAAELDATRVAESRWLVIYNIGAESGGVPVAGQNLWAYQDTGVVTPPDARFELVASGSTQRLAVKDAAGFRFAFASPQRRLFLAREAVRYRCDLATGILWRETFDTLDLTKPPLHSTPLSDAVSRCAFIYQPGTHTRQSLVTLRLSLSRDGETISLVQQVHVDNAP